MKKLLMTCVGLIALGMAAPALAADMAVKAPPPPPAPLPVIYNWSGFYIGANGGWGQSHNCVDFITSLGTVASGCADRSGGVVGGQIGYRWQTNQFVFGLEAQGDWADLSNTRVSLFDPTLSTTTKTDGIGLFTGQIGWAWNASLLYFKGGAAVTSNRLDIFDNITGLGQRAQCEVERVLRSVRHVDLFRTRREPERGMSGRDGLAQRRDPGRAVAVRGNGRQEVGHIEAQPG